MAPLSSSEDCNSLSFLFFLQLNASRSCTSPQQALDGFRPQELSCAFTKGEDSMRIRVFRSLLSFLLIPVGSLFLSAAGQAPKSDPQAVAFATKAVAALTNGTTINDVTLTGTISATDGPDTVTGTATLMASGKGESRIDLLLPNGTRTEIRDTSTGTPQGKWVTPDSSSGKIAFHNCQTDAVWFFPALSSLLSDQNTVLTYVGIESRGAVKTQHIQSYVYSATQPSQLSVMDFYLDAATLLPVAITFNTHPDDNAGTNLSVEVVFANYQLISGAMVPTRVQRYQEGNLMLDLAVSTASFNTGVSLSNFAIN